MELYFAPYACSMVVRIVADEADVPLTYREVEVYAKRFTEGGADYLAAAPRGQVPVLVLDDGDTLTEVSAIVQCIADMSPERGLLGTSPREHYRVLEGLNFAATEVHKRLLFVLGSQFSPSQARAYAREVAPRIFGDLARLVGTRPFYAGERFTIADAYFAWTLVMARTFRLDLSAVEPYAARLVERASVARALAVETPLVQASWRRQKEVVGEPPWLR
jgi:glutathione S-transferase